jgi:hypothetical protein
MRMAGLLIHGAHEPSLATARAIRHCPGFSPGWHVLAATNANNARYTLLGIVQPDHGQRIE